MEKLVQIWETFVGTYVLGTPWITIFYALMGVRLAPRSMLYGVKTFIRAFDLVHCAAGSVIKTEKWGLPIQPAFISPHGVFLDAIAVSTATDDIEPVYPGYDEAAELTLAGKCLGIVSDDGVPDPEPRCQKWTAPWVYLLISCWLLLIAS